MNLRGRVKRLEQQLPAAIGEPPTESITERIERSKRELMARSSAPDPALEKFAAAFESAANREMGLPS